MKRLNSTTSWLIVVTFSIGFLYQTAGTANAQMPQPTEHHKLLLKDVGTWNASVKSWVGDDGTMLDEPTMTTGTEKNYMVGGFWMVGEYEGKFYGQPFTGRSTMGYDMEKKQFVGSWIDSFSPSAMTMTGKWNKEKNTMTWETLGMGMDGKPTKGKSVQEYKEDGTRVFSMYSAMPGHDKLQKVMEMTYTKVKSTKGEK
ncbi:MAG: DUF1579 domain-containing protein [Planctomycetota bacterium]